MRGNIWAGLSKGRKDVINLAFFLWLQAVQISLHIFNSGAKVQNLNEMNMIFEIFNPKLENFVPNEKSIPMICSILTSFVSLYH